MTSPGRTRTLWPWVVGAMLLATLSLLSVVWIKHDGADSGALDAPGYASRAAPAAGSDVVPDSGGMRPAQALIGLTAPPRSATLDDVLGPEVSYFAGVPRELTAPFSLTGRVVDPHGAPIVGANVRYQPDALTRTIVGRFTGERHSDLPSTCTDADGRFTFHSLRGRPASSLPEQFKNHESVKLIVSDDRWVGLEYEEEIVAFSGADLGTLVARPGSILRGRVVGIDGKPLSGIRVRSNVATSSTGNLISCVSDEAGCYAFTGIEGGSGFVRIEQPGWLLTTVELPDEPSGPVLQAPDLVADAGLSIAGAVRDEDGQPVAGAAVQVFDQYWHYADGERWSDVWREQTAPDIEDVVLADTSGRFLVSGLTNAPRVVLAGASDFDPALVKNVWPATTPVTITLKRATAVRVERSIVIVLADEDERPVIGGRVLAETNSHDDGSDFHAPVSLGVIPDPERADRYTVQLSGERDCCVAITAPGFTSTWAVFTEQDALPTLEHRVVLVRELRLTGSLLDDAGAPVPFGWISLRPGGAGGGVHLSTQVLSDENGRFVFGGLGPGLWNVEAVADGMVDEDELQVSLAPSEVAHDLTIILQRLCVIEGMLRTAQGTCPPEADGELIELLHVPDDEDLGDDTASDVNGNFQFAVEQPGRYQLTGPLGAQAVVDVHRGDVSKVILVVPKRPRVTGRVLFGEAPVAGARIQALVHNSLGSETDAAFLSSFSLDALPLSDAAGRFTFEVDHAGEYSLMAVTAGGSASDVQLVTLAADEEAHIELLLGTGSASGLAIDAATRAPVAGVRIGLPDGVCVVTGADGRFSIERIPQGARRLLVLVPGWFGPSSLEIPATSGASVTGLLIELRKESGLSVNVVGPNGLPSRALVVLWRADRAPMPDGKKVHFLWADREVVSFGALEPGTYRLGADDGQRYAWDSRIEFWEREIPNTLAVVLTPGDALDVILHLQARP